MLRYVPSATTRKGGGILVRNAGFRRLIGQLPLNDRERFKREHLKEIEALRTKDGIWLDVGVLYTVGTKPI